MNPSKFLFKATFFVVAVLVVTCLNGLALSSLWEWFVVPGFGAPPLNFVPACGIILILGLVLPQSTKVLLSQQEEEEAMSRFGELLFYCIAFPLGVLFIGWILHFFM